MKYVVSMSDFEYSWSNTSFEFGNFDEARCFAKDMIDHFLPDQSSEKKGIKVSITMERIEYFTEVEEHDALSD